MRGTCIGPCLGSLLPKDRGNVGVQDSAVMCSVLDGTLTSCRFREAPKLSPRGCTLIYLFSVWKRTEQPELSLVLLKTKNKTSEFSDPSPLEVQAGRSETAYVVYLESSRSATAT